MEKHDDGLVTHPPEVERRVNFGLEAFQPTGFLGKVGLHGRAWTRHHPRRTLSLTWRDDP